LRTAFICSLSGPAWVDRETRSHPAGDYLIFYRIDRAGIIIPRVLHGRRDIAFLFRR
jgi:plasmid stabilization system protein ParE